MLAARHTAEPYTLLGVPPGVDDATLKQAYRTQIRAVHPDLVAVEGPEAEARAKALAQALNEAYERIKQDRAHHQRARTLREGAPPTALEALRRAQVAVDHAKHRVADWRNLLRALRKAHATVLAQRARMGALPQAARPPEAVDAAVYQAARAVVQARLTDPLVELAAADLAAARSHFAALPPNKVLAVAAEAEVAARQRRDQVSREAARARAQLQRLSNAGRLAQSAGRDARRAAQALRRQVPTARESVEAAVLAAALAAGLAKVEAAANPNTVAAKRTLERSAAFTREATRLEREQLLAEEAADSARTQAEATIAAARHLAAAARAPEAADQAWQQAAKAARRAMIDVLERVMADAEAQVRQALRDPP